MVSPAADDNRSLFVNEGDYLNSDGPRTVGIIAVEALLPDWDRERAREFLQQWIEQSRRVLRSPPPFNLYAYQRLGANQHAIVVRTGMIARPRPGPGTEFPHSGEEIRPG